MLAFVALFPGLCCLQFLITCSRCTASDQKLETKKAWDQGYLHIAHGKDQVEEINNENGANDLSDLSALR